MTADAQDLINQIRSQLQDAWSVRSGPENATAARLAQQTTTSTTGDDDLDTVLLRRVLDRAAMSGDVLPDDLLRALDQPHHEVLARIATSFDRRVSRGAPAWCLRSRARHEAYASMSSDHRINEVLDDVAAIPTDPAGDLLRALIAASVDLDYGPAVATQSELTTADVDLILGSDASLKDRTQALGWAAALIPAFETASREYTRRTQVGAIADSYAVLTQHGMFGRDRKREELLKFVSDTPTQGGPVPVMSLTGVGGIGKSTLLASVILPMLDDVAHHRAGMSPVVIDMDRVAFRAHAGAELSMELLKQLGFSWSEHSAILEMVRSRSRKETSARNALHRDAPDLEALNRTSSRLEWDAGQVLAEAGLADRPVLLVIDTFEEWQRDRPDPTLSRGPWSSNDPEAQIMEWIDSLSYSMGLSNLRVVISGRAPIQQQARRNLAELHLGELAQERRPPSLNGFVCPETRYSGSPGSPAEVPSSFRSRRSSTARSAERPLSGSCEAVFRRLKA